MKDPLPSETRFELWSDVAAIQGVTERYAFLDGTLISNTPLTDFEPFRIEELKGSGDVRPDGSAIPGPSPWCPEDSLQLVFEDNVMLGDVAMDVRCLRSEHCLRLIGPAAEIEIDRHGRRIRARLLDGKPQGLRSFLGASWVVAATFRNWFVLHAGAVAQDGRAVGFLGASGAGKSTLSAALSRRGDRRLVADDMLACSAALDGTGFQISPRFPQPSLGRRGEELLNFPTPRLDLGALCFLSSAEPGETVRLEELPRSRAVGFLTSAVVGLAWMGADQVSRVLDTLARLTAVVPCYRLIYPHTEDSTGRVEQILDDL